MREYYIMIISGTLTMLSGGFIWTVYAPFVREEFTAPLFLVGLAVSGYFVLRMLSEFPIGILSDRIGPKYPLIAGRLLAILGAFICYTTTNIWALIFARIIWGVGDASFFCIGMTYVSKLFPSEKRGRALGIFQAVEMIGSFIGQTMGGFIAVLYGVRFNFLLGTFIGVIVLVLVSMTKGIEEKSSRDKPKSSFIPTFDDLRIVLNGTVVAACFINLFSMIVNTGLLNTILPIYAIEELSFSLTNFSFLVSGSTVGSVIGNLFGGVLSDRIGRKKVLIGGFILGAFSVYNLGVFTSFMPLLLFMFLKGIFWGIVYGVTPAYIADSVSDDARGMAIGIYRTFLDLGGLAGPIILSTLVDSVGYPQGYGYAFNFSSILILLCMIFVLKLKETK